MALPLLNLDDLKKMVSSTMKTALSVGLLLLLLPAILLSLLLITILLSPVFIVSLIYLAGLENILIFNFGSLLDSVTDELVPLVSQPESPSRGRKLTRTLHSPLPARATLQGDGSISNPRQSKAELLGDGRSSQRPYGTALAVRSGNEKPTRKAIPTLFMGDDLKFLSPCGDEGKNGPQNSPESSPFDLMRTDFSPHWSAGKPTSCLRSPSPLDLSSTKMDSPTHWPSPVAKGTPDINETNEPLSPVRIRAALQQAMEDSIASQLQLPSDNEFFTTPLPDALRNISGKLEDTREALDNSSSSADDDSLEMIIPKFNVRVMSDVKKQSLISRFRAVIEELEGSTENGDAAEESAALYSKERQAGAPTPPPRPAAIPRNRAVGGENGRHRFRDFEGSTWKPIPKLVLPPPPPENSPTRNRSPAADGLYGTDKVDHDYWHGFDQTYNFTERSFDSTTFEEELRNLQWKHSMGKWAEKGVSVMKPLDEESIGSNSSFKPSPVSKKEVRFAETTDAILYESPRPLSPAAEMVRHHNTPTSSPKKNPSSPILTVIPTENIVSGQENENSKMAENLKVGPEVVLSPPAPETPARQVLSKISNRDPRPNSPVLSPSGTVSGKLIKLFEELSKTNTQSPSRSLDSSPTPSVRVDTTAMDQIMHSTSMTMDGLDETVDGAAKEIMLDAQLDGAFDNPDGLDECF